MASTDNKENKACLQHTFSPWKQDRQAGQEQIKEKSHSLYQEEEMRVFKMWVNQ